jgi:chromosome segregation protein
LRTTAALAEQRLKNSETNLQYGRAEQKRLAEQIAGRDGQLALLDKQRATLQTDLEQAQAEFSKLGGQLDGLRAEINPLEKELETLEKEQADSEKRWNSLSSTLLTLEAAHSRAELESQRVQNELDNLMLQASTDLAPSLIAEQGENFRVDPEEWTELLELSGDEAKQLQERIEQHRGKLRRIGVVNPLALQEYKETSTRHSFLSGQLADLEQAALSLRSLIKELDTLTQQKFGETFELVAREFSKYFGLLFNGGSAKLFLTDPENLAQTGIEIIAQPPGKRQQNLALLSGGERALTAVALLFALLEVNPTPFCVLDEVDAALDEANVNRFCETLQKLAARTQFIVITHNRGTIESARTIYGISMGADSVSKTISLRVDEVAKFRQAASTNGHKNPPKPVGVS